MSMCKLSQQAIDDILRQGRIYEVGGTVRDRLLGQDNSTPDKDYLVTGIPYDDLSKVLKKHGEVNLVGKSFGVIKFTQTVGGAPQTLDITLPRREHSTGVGHKDFNVAFDPFLKVEDDLSRRDFTVNAMALALDTKELIDPLDGRLDIEKRQLRMVYDASFQDDPLRMLRAVQFAARFEFTIESKTFETMRRHASLINSVSSERIAEELNKLLVLAKKPSVGFRLMQTSGLLKEILPELEECVGVKQPGGYHMYDVFEHTLYTIDACQPQLRLRLAALFHDINKPQHKREVKDGAAFYGHESTGAKTARSVMRRLRYPNELTGEVATLVERHMFTTNVTDKGLRRLIRRVGQELIFDLLDLRRADVEAQGRGGTTEDVDQFERQIRDELSRKPPLTASDLALNGYDVMKLFDLKPGPTVGEIIDYLLECVLDNPENNTHEILRSLATEYFDKNIKQAIENKTYNNKSNNVADKGT